MLLRRVSDWPTWGWKSPFDELERMRRQMDWLSGCYQGVPHGQILQAVHTLTSY